jgi:DnaJ-class molecular chaperone
MNSSNEKYNPYAILGVDRKASLGEIKKAYFKMVRLYPPEESPEKFKEIRKAYEDIKDPEKRTEIDLFLIQPPPELPNYREENYDISVHPEDIIKLALEIRLESITTRKDFNIPKI